MQPSPGAQPIAVQFYVEDMEEFRKFADQMFDALRDKSLIHGAQVTAIGREDVFTQLDELEHPHDP